ncbi:MAG: hypothetical protein ACYDCH_04950 [Gaiellaceae bacterium]
MRRLVLFVGVILVLATGVAAFDWWVNPAGQVWEPGALAAARADHCLLSQELVGDQYWRFKRDIAAHRLVRTFVVGSSRVLQIASRPGETSFANLGYPGSAPETVLKLFRSLPPRPLQTVYVGVEAFWFNASYSLPETEPSFLHQLEYVLSWGAFRNAVHQVREQPLFLTQRWRRLVVGRACTIGRFYPSINWRVDGSRVWSWELDPHRFPRFTAQPFTGDLATWRNGYYARWARLDEDRLHVLAEALSLARSRGWRVVGFPPPEPPAALRALERDPRLAVPWGAFLATMPRVFARYGYAWLPLEDGRSLACRARDFPDAFHSDAACSRRVRARLDAVAAGT